MPVVARTIEDILEHVAAGRGLVVLPLSAAVYFSRSDLIHTPITDVAPSHVYLAWERSRRSPLIREYAEIAGAVLQHADPEAVRRGAGPPVPAG